MPLMSSISSDEAVYPFVIHSWARTADVLQGDFNPYVGAVIDIVLPHALGDVTSDAKSGANSEVIFEDDGFKLYLDYGAVDLKKHSVHLLAVIANFCTRDHLHRLLKAFLDGVDFSWDPQVNQCAALSLLALVSSAKREFGPTDPKTLDIFYQGFNKLLESLCDTEDSESGVIIVNCLKNLVRKEGELVRVTQSQKPESVPMMLANLIKAVELWGYHFEMSETRLDNQNFDEYNKEFIKEDLACFDQMSKEISLLAGEILAIFGDACAPIVTELVENKFDELWNKEQVLYKRTVIYFISDFVENIKPEYLVKVLEIMCTALFQAVNMDDPGITQAAFNALGVMGSKGSPIYSSIIDKICTDLSARLQTYPTEMEHQCARENCIAAIIKTAHLHKKPQLYSAFQHLPLFADRTEAKICHKIFVLTLDQNQEQMLGSQNENIVGVTRLFLQLYERREQICDNDTAQYVQNFLQTVGRQAGSSLSGSLNQSELGILKQAISATSI